MVVVAVDEHDVDLLLGQRAGDGHAAEAGADDHDPRPATAGGGMGGGTGTVENGDAERR